MASNPLLMPAQPPAPKLLLSAREASHALGICEKTLWNITAPRGPLEAVRIGRSVRYSVKDLQAFIEGQKGGCDEG